MSLGFEEHRLDNCAEYLIKILVSCVISEGTCWLTHNILLLLYMKTVGASHSSLGITACFTVWPGYGPNNKISCVMILQGQQQPPAQTLLNVTVCCLIARTSTRRNKCLDSVHPATDGEGGKNRSKHLVVIHYSLQKPQPLFKKLANVFQTWATHEKACRVPPGYVGCAWLPGQEWFSVNHCSSKVKLHWHHRENTKNVY